VFYTTWCGHCRALEPKYIQLARDLKNDKSIGIGAIDCDDASNRPICGKYGVNGFPALKAMVSGKPKSYNGAREADPMKEWIKRVASSKGTKGGSAKCPIGVFKSKVKDAVVPLCEEHFPDEKAKNDWLVIFYDEKASSVSDLKQATNTAALELGNEPPDKNKALKKLTKRRDRLQDLADVYDLKLTLPNKGPFGMDALVKIGAVCCDCNDDTAAFCSSSLKLGEEDFKPPRTFWVSKGRREMLKGDGGITAHGLIANALSRLGYYAGAGEAEGSSRNEEL
jgi:thiol-disulfide isomerase/thioredoxin